MRPAAGKVCLVGALIWLAAHGAAGPASAQVFRLNGRWEMGAAAAQFETAAHEREFHLDAGASVRLQAQTLTFPLRIYFDQRIVLQGPVGRKGEWEADGDLDRLFARYFTRAGHVSAGKQFVNWGVGHAFSPTDVFNPPDPADPGRMRPGITALVWEHSVGPLDYWSLVAAEGKYGVRRRGHGGGFDWSALAVYDEGDAVVGFDLDGDWGAGWRLAGACRMPGGGPEKHRFDGLLGADFSWLGGRLVWLAELAFTLGADAESTPSQMFQQVSYSVDEFTSVYASVLYSALDPSQEQGLWSAGLATYLGREAELQVGGTFLTGEAPPFAPRALLRAQISQAF